MMPQADLHARSRTATVVVSLLSVFLLPSGDAVHDDGLFELGNGVNPTQSGSGDILGNASQPGPDWADLFFANGSTNLSAVSAFGGITAVFLKDQLAVASGTDNTAYSSTSDKNNDPIPTWTWGTQNVPAKDDLSNAYAYAVVNPANGHTIVYVGFERIVANGDSHIDIEMFQQPVGLDHAVPCPSTLTCHFVGNRTQHDVLVAVDFSNGGDLGSVSVRLFNNATKVYDEVENLTGEGCNGLAAANLTPDSICAFDNGGNIDGGPWPNYDNHAHVITNLTKNAFTEFGLDLTNAGGGSTPCISTILGKTRSSQSFTAELKDFAGPFPFSLCGGSIQIKPDAVNEVNQTHTFNVYVNRSVAGTNSSAPDGTKVNVTLNATNGSTVTLINDSCATTGTVGGVCSVRFTSPTAGIVTGHATANLTFGGTTISLVTDGAGSNSGDAVKRFVDARITIAPSAVNEVNQTHTFVVTVQQNAGDGNGFVNATNGHVTVSLTATNGSAPVVNATASTCANAGNNLNASGQCTQVFTSPTAGTVVGSATVVLNVSNLTLTRTTNGSASNSGPATKVFVDAFITINPPLAFNNVGQPHTFTVAVKQNAGDGNGFVNATSGHVTVTLNASDGATPVVNTSASTCDDSGNNLDANGTCVLVFTSATAGTVVGHATVTLNILGLNVTRQTDGIGQDSGDAVKVFVNGVIAWTKVDNTGALLGGATFTVCRTQTFNASSEQNEDTADACFDVTDNVAPDTNTTPGGFALVNLTLGEYTVHEKTPPPGFAPDTSTQTVDINVTSPSATIARPFVDLRPSVKISAFGYTNVANGTPTAGVVNGNTTFTFSLHNYGGATAVVNSTLAVTGNATFAGITGPGTTSAPSVGASCGAGCTATWSLVSLAPGADATFTFAIEYHNVPDGTVINASLAAVYTTGLDGFTRSASGSPATISFTVQSD